MIFQCDVCIGKPDDWCDVCDTCLHQCQCDFLQEAAEAERKNEG